MVLIILYKALAKLIALEIPRKQHDDDIVYPRVVQVQLKCDIKPTNEELYDSLLK